MHIRTKFVQRRYLFCHMVNGYHVSLRRHRSVEQNSSFCHFLCCVSYLVSTEFSQGTDVDVEQNFVEMGDKVTG